MLQVGLGAHDRPQVVTFAQHSWRQGCAWEDVPHDRRPAWVASRERWGSSRAAWWNPAEQSSPVGPRFQDDGRWSAPAAWHDGARSCASGPPGYPWWVFAAVAVPAALLLARALRGRVSRAC